ncbi:uncharacterized protein PADG_11326 [Paracoccidioides brasiliensis Pb18]|uniref:Uncharacterized protein n=1 Tax=Paracoccidioides brasiliensis (strain Pb18) TaxID=502780 RepID=A0A0A0HVT1_PARBD|nr:uncharacterized protein PADG_11326 [Paracoccidioides brasiliensis Pb18]KGM92503.1 hypothetical protein PADG_11326 [Paracoccidioides brasiliensis Pb18]
MEREGFARSTGSTIHLQLPLWRKTNNLHPQAAPPTTVISKPRNTDGQSTPCGEKTKSCPGQVRHGKVGKGGLNETPCGENVSRSQGFTTKERPKREVTSANSSTSRLPVRVLFRPHKIDWEEQPDVIRNNELRFGTKADGNENDGEQRVEQEKRRRDRTYGELKERRILRIPSL